MDNQSPYGPPNMPSPGNFDTTAEKKHHPGVIIGLLAGLAIILLGLLIWVFTMYSDQKNNVDQIAQERVNVALEEQEQELRAEFKQQNEADTTTYRGAEVVGSPRFEHPKDWSVYANEAPEGSSILSVIAHPTAVKSSTKEYALRFQAIDKTYQSVLSSYDEAIGKGEVRSAPIKSNGVTGVKLTGRVYDGRDGVRTGTMVIFGVRDKTIALWTESDDYSAAFNRAVDTLQFQP